ncbi:hypothetical protein KAR48_03015 [bacterium]|nr:hypothetical protein [bacterium]
MLKQLPVLQCPDSVNERLKDIIGEENKTARFYGRRTNAGAGRWILAGAGLVLGIFFIIMVDRQGGSSIEISSQKYTQEEIAQARAQLKWTVGHVGKKINKAKKNVVEDIFFQELPRAVHRSLKQSLSMIKGG